MGRGVKIMKFRLKVHQCKCTHCDTITLVEQDNWNEPLFSCPACEREMGHMRDLTIVEEIEVDDIEKALKEMEEYTAKTGKEPIKIKMNEDWLEEQFKIRHAYQDGEGIIGQFYGIPVEIDNSIKSFKWVYPQEKWEEFMEKLQKDYEEANKKLWEDVLLKILGENRPQPYLMKVDPSPPKKEYVTKVADVLDLLNNKYNK